jgi:hypothetical protein
MPVFLKGFIFQQVKRFGGEVKAGPSSDFKVIQCQGLNNTGQFCARALNERVALPHIKKEAGRE